MSGEAIAKEANTAFAQLKVLTNGERSQALENIYKSLKENRSPILDANKLDLENAKAKNLSSSLIKRLDLSNSGKFDSMLQGILDVANLPDPVGKMTLAKKIDEGLNLYRITAPIGVLLIIFESRPEVIANITALAIKSGNAAILKGGKESYQTFKVMSNIVTEALADSKVPSKAIQLIESREDVADLLDQDKYIDLVIPRGSNELVRNIKSNTKIPVLGHADGICSIYVDSKFDPVKAKRIIVDSKTNYPAGCNAVEQLLLNKDIAKDEIKSIIKSLVDTKVVVHVTPELKPLIADLNQDYIADAEDDSFDKEYLSLDISVKFVENVKEAIDHINKHSSKHTECIITENKDTADLFLKSIDSAGIYWNASTRFADGFRYGFGTEVGISTNKIHARGPVGLEGLMSYQYQLKGDGHIVGDYVGGGGDKLFVHEDI
ncbi:Pro2 gamma-glutamyl phosphate reductase [Candida orthopsilosis Co 90-125]|uniref:glutamate-5-semialdehyde dehydrogenase n=1 Tax=Candida orthopsilosis (strain 90-125) TaxID=1136231 RepID=H8X3C5_CANO9|nr:Pro2 gamma-glutamyl phosphate reductase [Candida orthopsilosis Co 90-125]CCG25398.1 Pro2 gamma-glutamyl phosphate reductase [Candida orthopsilosis Co 90-125]